MSARIPPTKLVRLVERARHRLALIHLRMVPPYAAMMELIVSAWTSQAITVAVELGIADALDKGPLRLEELASRVEADPDALRRLLRALIGRGIFRQRRDGRYALNALAKSLRANAPLSAAAMAEMVGSALHREHWSHLTDSGTNRQGGPSRDARHGSLRVPRSGARIQCSLQPRHGRHHRDGGGLPDGRLFVRRYQTVVDVGGGVGRLLCAILEATPSARGVLYDLPHALAEAPPVLRQHHVADRVELLDGSFFDSVPTGGDVYVLKMILHDWPDDKAVEILQTVRSAAKVGTKVLVIDCVIPDHDREFLGHWTDLEMLLCRLDANERCRSTAVSSSAPGSG